MLPCRTRFRFFHSSSEGYIVINHRRWTKHTHKNLVSIHIRPPLSRAKKRFDFAKRHSGVEETGRQPKGERSETV